MTEIPLCVNCKHHKNTGGNHSFADLCLRPEIQVINPINGKAKKVYCKFERTAHDSCKVEGNLWEPKDG